MNASDKGTPRIVRTCKGPPQMTDVSTRGCANSRRWAGVWQVPESCRQQDSRHPKAEAVEFDEAVPCKAHTTVNNTGWRLGQGDWVCH